jgi:hypothetical protein
MLYYFTINTSVELTCFIVALVCLYNQPEKAWKSMILFIFIIVLAEFTGRYLKKIYLQDIAHNLSNAWVYNTLLIAQALFFSLHFKYLLGRYTNSKPIFWGGLAIISILYIYELYNHGFYVYNNSTYTVLLVLLMSYSLYFYYHLLKDEAYIELKTSANFWWVTGILFFCFGTIISSLFREKLSPILITSKAPLTTYIYNTLNIILYSCWSYSFICKKWQTSTSKK